MQLLNYNRIKGKKKSVGDYLQTLNNEDLQMIYSSSFFYNLKMPDLVKKMRDELQKRKLNAQPMLF